jgi:AcrR family transcriptional regulator
MQTLSCIMAGETASSRLADLMAHYRPHLKTAKDARAVRTRAALRNALLQLLGSKPLDEVTILDICQAAGIGYTTFFRHHATKEALLDDVAAEQIAQLIALTVPIAETEDVHAAGIALFTYVSEHRILWSALLTGGAEAAMHRCLATHDRRESDRRVSHDPGSPAGYGGAKVGPYRDHFFQRSPVNVNGGNYM